MKKVLILIITMLSINMLMGSSSTTGHSDAMHKTNIEKLIVDYYQRNNYDLFPLYGFDDQIVGYLAEYSDTFAYGLIKDTEKSNCSGSNYNYILKVGEPWARYTYNMITYPDEYEIEYEKKERDITLYHNESHYKAAGITDEKRYMIKCLQAENSDWKIVYVPAVKRDGKFYNLLAIGLPELEIKPLYYFNEIPSMPYGGKAI